MEMENGDAFGSVSVEEKTGAGLPYAPQDWPNPGDVWTWKLGRRISTDGFYRDRIIFLPRRLHQKGKRKYFDSRKSIITYLQSEFPDTDVDAFFQSFTWKVRARFNTSGEKVDKRGAVSSGKLQSLDQVTPRPKKVHPRSKSEKTGDQSKSEKTGEAKYRRRSWRLVLSKSSSKKRIRFSSKEVKDVIDLSSLSNGTRSCESTADISKSTTDSKNIRASSSENTGSQSSKDSTHCHSPKEIPSESIPNDSDMLIDSADNVLSQSLPKSSDVGPVNDQSATSQEKMFAARKKLLLLIAKDDPGTSSSIKLPEIMNTDPNIDANRHGILKLIDEIPLAWKEFQENKKMSEAADKYSEDLETNIAWATTLVNEYNQSKGYEYVLHKELDSISLNIENIDEQISALQSRRDELASAADVKNKLADLLVSKQKKAAECLSNAVHVVEMCKKRRQIWELEKEISEEKKAKNFIEFVPLRDFFL